MAEVLYRAANATISSNSLPEATVRDIWHGIVQDLNTGAIVEENLDLDTPAGLARALVLSGDGVLNRIRFHTINNDLHMPEQLDKNTGAEASATDLTWSYATILKAMAVRSASISALDRNTMNVSVTKSTSTDPSAIITPIMGVAVVGLIAVVSIVIYRRKQSHGYSPIQ